MCNRMWLDKQWRVTCHHRCKQYKAIQYAWCMEMWANVVSGTREQYAGCVKYGANEYPHDYARTLMKYNAGFHLIKNITSMGEFENTSFDKHIWTIDIRTLGYLYLYAL